MSFAIRVFIARTKLLAGIVMILVLAFGGPVRSSDVPLAPQTKLRVTVVQWMPMKGAYEQWTALGGEFTVSEDSTLVLPVIGSIDVGRMDGGALGAEISRRLQVSIGTVDKPDTTVEILQYPPVYVVGDVKNPGTYGFRAGLTVLQALALGGGEIRPGPEQSRDQIRLVGDLQGFENEVLRASAKIARLRAEMADARVIDFPSAPQDSAGKALAAEVYAQEEMIFLARRNELDRQMKSLTELRELLNAEIVVLEQKIVAADAGIAADEKELSGVMVLVDKGIAIASRRTDLERALAGQRSDRLDQVTAVMRARQNVAEATRNLDGLHDSRRTAVASELQREQGSLEQTVLKREVTQRLLLDLLSAPSAGLDEETLTFTIVRKEAGETNEMTALESTPLLPGDVVRVALSRLSSTSEKAAFRQVSQ